MTKTQAPKHTHTVERVVFSFFAVVLLTFVFVVVVAIGPAGSFKRSVLKVLPVPMAIINGQPISTKDYLERVAVTKTLTGEADVETQSFEKLVMDTKIAQLARGKGVRLDNEEVNSEFSRLQPSVKISADSFKNIVLKPELLKQHLEGWYNSSRELNPDAYKKVDAAMALLNAGRDFDSVASTYSEDELTSGLGGNLGFVETAKLLPEIREKVRTVQNGDIVLLGTREGVQILKVLGKDSNGPGGLERYQLQGILIHTTGFEQWVTNETKNYSVYKLIQNY